MTHQHINPSVVQQPLNYSHVVVGSGTRFVYVSGQIPTDAGGRIVGDGDLATQMDQVFANLKVCLTAADASLTDVTRLTTYVVNYQPEMWDVVSAVRARHLPEEPPASTLIGVQALARPGLLVEIDAVALLP